MRNQTTEYLWFASESWESESLTSQSREWESTTMSAEHILDNRVKILWEIMRQNQLITTYVHKFMTRISQSIKVCALIIAMLTNLRDLQYVSFHLQKFDYILIHDEWLFLKDLNFLFHKKLRTLITSIFIILNILKNLYNLMNYEESKKQKENKNLLRISLSLKIIIVDNFEEDLIKNKFLVLLERYIKDISSLKRITLFSRQSSQSLLMQFFEEMCVNKNVKFCNL